MEGPPQGECCPAREPQGFTGSLLVPPDAGAALLTRPCRVRLPTGRLRLVMRLVSQLGCLPSESGSIPLRGAERRCGLRIKERRKTCGLPRGPALIQSPERCPTYARAKVATRIPTSRKGVRFSPGMLRADRPKGRCRVRIAEIRVRVPVGPRARVRGHGSPRQGDHPGATPGGSTSGRSSKHASGGRARLASAYDRNRAARWASGR